MSQTARVFRILVSSTLSDLKDERNALRAYALARLRESCEKHNACVLPINSRWGVCTEASLDQQALHICLSEVARSQQVNPQPNSDVLMDDRSGWIPPPAQIPEDEYQAVLAVVSDQDKALLDAWCTLDENTLPAEGRLNPREKDGPHKDCDVWQPVEADLQPILSDTVQQLNWPAEQRSIYRASATHHEILDSAPRQIDAHKCVFGSFPSIPGLPRVFSALVLQEMLENRLALKLLRGLSSACTALVDAVLTLLLNASAAVGRIQTGRALEDAPDESPEQDNLEFMRQVLADMIAKDLFNLDGMRWTVGDNADKNSITSEVGLALVQFLTRGLLLCGVGSSI